MKISRKIIGVVLVVIMVLNIFAVGVFAAFPTDTAVKLALSADKTNYAKGETITLTFSEQVIAEIGAMRIGGQYDMGYNSSVFELMSADTNALESHNFVAKQAGYDAGISGVQIPSSSGVSTLYDWDAAVTWNVGDDTSTTFTATEMTDLFTVQIKVKENAPDGTYTIGFNPAGYEGYTAYSNDGAGYGGLYGVNAQDADMGYSFSVPNMYEYGTCTITVGQGGGSKVKVNNLSTQIQWADKDAGRVNLGFRGQIAAGYDATTDFDGTTGPNGGKNLAKLTEVGFYINSSKVPAYTIYDFVSGGYFYRVVVGSSYNDTTSLSAQAYVVIDGQTYTADSTFTTSAKEQYERATALVNGMEPK